MNDESKDSVAYSPLLLEYVDSESAAMFQEMVAAGDLSSPLLTCYAALQSELPEGERVCVRVVGTGNLVQSVNDRESREGHPFRIERGDGIVAAKTMPMDSEGTVDILLPTYVFSIEGVGSGSDTDLSLLLHTAAHEVVHARHHLLGTGPFDTCERGDFEWARLQFVAMAGEQLKEHVAETISGAKYPPAGISMKTLASTFDAFWREVSSGLKALPEGDPNRYGDAAYLCLNALHVVWKVLAYYAAEFRANDEITALPRELENDPGWRAMVGDWWPRYTTLLLRVPATVEVDISATDAVVLELAGLLQDWARSLGFDAEDRAEGGYFSTRHWPI